MLCPGWRTKGHRGFSNLICSGHGTCMSMASAAASRDDRNLFAETTYRNVWDHDMIYGCVCWEGYTGYDCSVKMCPYGDDPLTVGQSDEVQIVECTCASCSGTFALKVLGETTTSISHDATASDIQLALESLSSIRSVSVQLHDIASDGGGRICDGTGAALAVTFTHNPGNLPTMIALPGTLTSSGGGGSATLQTLGGGVSSPQGASSVDGTREYLECANRGTCDRVTGTCQCWNGFSSSDGAGATGATGDCGYFDGVGAATCPVGGPDDEVCSGHGTCSGAVDEYTCICHEGYIGGDCSLLECPVGRSWFDEATDTDEAHAEDAECSDMGTCNRDNGECQCDFRFEGGACERLKCPLTDSQYPCSRDFGHCISIQDLAFRAEINGEADPRAYGDDDTMMTWDHSMIHGCQCDSPVLDTAAESYGGRSTVVGYKCHERRCPTGDDPLTSGQVDEEQRFTCTETSGSITLTFRRHSTTHVSYDATFAELVSALEDLPTVGRVQVAPLDPTQTMICGAGGVVETSVTFVTEHGDLPSLSIQTNAGSPISVSEHVKGTKEEIECSGRGVCDRRSGVCRCFDGFASSDGVDSRGPRGDCSFVSAGGY
eukprot:g4097.t1